MGKGISRRDFLKVVGTSGSALGLGLAASKKKVLAEEDPYRVIPEGEHQAGEWVPTGCAGCTSWCSLEANIVDGRVIKVRGNSNSKVNGESNCPRSHLGIQQVYDPDRIKSPMKRTNPEKGRGVDPEFVPISWDEAMEEIADKVMELRENGESHKFVLWRGRYTRLRDILYGTLPKFVGSPNNISHSSICAEAEKFGPYYTEGYWSYRDYDVDNSDYILIWGTDPIQSNRQVSMYMKKWGEVMDNAKIATVDPRFSRTAAKSDEWLPVKPGEDGALALAMAHVILSEGLWHREFVGDFNDGENHFVVGETVEEDSFTENYTHGVIKWWNQELKDRTPEWAAERTEVPAEQIRRVATEFGQAAPKACCFMGGGGVMQVRGGYNSMAVHALNGLVGSVDNEGGAIRGAGVPKQGFPDFDEYLDDISKAGIDHEKIDRRGRLDIPVLKEGKSGGGVVSNMSADAIIEEDPYEIKMGIGYWNNFNFSAPETERWDKAMAKIDFYVHIVTNQSEMSQFADILLPSSHHMFEQWGMLYQKGNRHTHFWLSKPMIKRYWPVIDPEAEFSWLLAEKLAEKGYTNMLDYFKTIVDPETGKEPEFYREFAEYATKHYMQPTWDPSIDSHGDQFNGWDDFKETGVWNSDQFEFKKYWGNFNTATGNFEFYSETLKDALTAHAEKHDVSVDEVLAACNYDVSGERMYLPHYEDPYTVGSEDEYPLLLIDSKAAMNREGRSANTGWYYDLKSIDLGDSIEHDVIKIHPQDAQKLGLEDGEEVKVSSPVGEVTCHLKVWKAVKPGTAAKTFGMGHWAYGRLAAENFEEGVPRGANNNDIIPAEYERLSGSTSYYGHTRINIEKA
ncbi:MAG: molybdopterin-dependent oxidoreductase [Halarsenatibacteraceae bacterium]